MQTKVQQSGHLKHLGETPLVQFAGSNGHKFHTAPRKLTYDMLKDAREGFSADPKPPPNHKAIFPKHCTPKPAQKPLAAPKSCHKPSKSLPRASKTTCQIFVANLVKTGTESPLISGGWKSLWHYVFKMFFHFSRACFAHPFWKEFTGTLFLGLPVFRVPVFPLFGRL